MNNSESFVTPRDVVFKEILGPHFTKYHLGDNKVLHHFTEAHDEYFHDHPWCFQSSILWGGYREEEALLLEDGTFQIVTHERLPDTTHTAKSGTVHKIIQLLDRDCWTLVVAQPEERKWGFYRADETGVWHRYHDQPDWQLLIPTLQLI